MYDSQQFFSRWSSYRNHVNLMARPIDRSIYLASVAFRNKKLAAGFWLRTTRAALRYAHFDEIEKNRKLICRNPL